MLITRMTQTTSRAFEALVVCEFCVFEFVEFVFKFIEFKFCFAFKLKARVAEKCEKLQAFADEKQVFILSS